MTLSPVFGTKWAALGELLGADLGGWRELGLELHAMYQEPHRAYHVVAHVEAVLEHLDGLVGGVIPSHLLSAAFFHDAIYDPLSDQNEHLSALLARDRLGALGVDAVIIADTVIVIEATAGHAVGNETTSLFLDADLAVLGADAVTYDGYARNIRFEYSHMTDDAYRSGRAALLSGFLRRPHIYATAQGRQRFEERARHNLEREVAGLLG